MARTPASRTRSRTRPAASARPADGSPHPPAPPTGKRPEVIVDFAVEGGLLLVTVANIGEASAYQVAIRFDHPFHGLGGGKDLSAVALFRSLPFLPPAKRITQLVDHADAYFRRGEPTRLTATISYTDRDGRRYTDAVPHDLEVYRDLAEPPTR